MKSAIYEGTVRHRRFAPITHEFRYRVAMLWIDLAELEDVFRGRWPLAGTRPGLLWWRRADYLGDSAVALDQAVRDLVESETGRRPAGPVRVLTQARQLGWCFNPVTFYQCHEADGSFAALVAEITNTPWGERHAYVLPAAKDEGPGLGRRRWKFAKTFHVSPFLPMDLGYDWLWVEPAESAVAHFEVLREDSPMFDATLTLKRRELDGRALAFMLLRHPLGTLGASAAIYWQALRLRMKGAPFFTHPAKRETPGRPA